LKRKIKIVDTGTLKIKVKTFVKPKKSPHSAVKIKIVEPQQGRLSRQGKSPSSKIVKKVVSMLLPVSDEEQVVVAVDEDVVMKSPPRSIIKQRDNNKLKESVVTPPPTPTPSSHTKKSPRVARRFNTPTTPISSSSKQRLSSSAPNTPSNKFERKVSKGSISSNNNFGDSDELSSGRWCVIKRWSRKQIERAIKSLIQRLYSANSAVPYPSEVTQFIQLALTNPSASVLFPHLVRYD
jgi:hypothetical protein